MLGAKRPEGWLSTWNQWLFESVHYIDSIRNALEFQTITEKVAADMTTQLERLRETKAENKVAY